MTHYIADLAVFGHVMGTSTPWGSETHHSDYEDYVNTQTSSYTGTFNTYLSYDGSLSTVSAYDAAINLAYDTTFGGSNHLTCVWMDDNYNWSNSTFSGRCGQSLNLAVNAVADVLHTLYQEAAPSSTTTQTPSPSPTPTVTPTLSPTTPPTPTDSSTPATNFIAKPKNNTEPNSNSSRVSNNTDANGSHAGGSGWRLSFTGKVA